MIRKSALAVALVVASPALAAPDLGESLKALQALDARVQSVGWRLVRGNARFCRDLAPAIGLQLLDTAGFADPAAVRSALGLPGEIAVEAVAAQGPAARAGLRPNQGLGVVAGRPVTALPAAQPGDYTRLAGLHDAIDAALVAHGKVAFGDANGTAIVVAGEPACPTRFELLTQGARAAANGRRVTIGRALAEELPEDELLAAALAHELAHNLLGHRARLDAGGRSWTKVKATEREADRLMPWLLANAGFDPSAAGRFFARWGPKHDLGLLATPDHDGWKSRVKRVDGEAARVAAARTADGGADWAAVFLTLRP